MNSSSQKLGRAWNPRLIAYGAMCIALAFVLDLFKLWQMPQGGSVTPAAMLPLIAFAYAAGFGPGVIVTFAYSLLELIDGSTIIHPIQYLLDYTFSYCAIALAAFAARIPVNKRVQLIIGIAFASFGRFFFNSLSGIIFFAQYAPEGQPVVIYSTLYNSFTLVDGLICAVVSLVPGVDRITDMIASVRKA